MRKYWIIGYNVTIYFISLCQLNIYLLLSENWVYRYSHHIVILWKYTLTTGFWDIFVTWVSGYHPLNWHGRYHESGVWILLCSTSVWFSRSMSVRWSSNTGNLRWREQLWFRWKQKKTPVNPVNEGCFVAMFDYQRAIYVDLSIPQPGWFLDGLLVTPLDLADVYPVSSSPVLIHLLIIFHDQNSHQLVIIIGISWYVCMYIYNDICTMDTQWYNRVILYAH